MPPPAPDAHGPRVAGLGEAGLLARLLPLLPAGPAALLGPGDDAALVAAPDARVVATTDVLVEGRDFRRDWSGGADVGWKAAAQNLADVAAMGAVPTGLLVALAVPQDLPAAWAEDLARGLAACCARAGTGVVGGDLSAASEVVVAVTALGDLQGRPPVRRDGARAGDVLALAGPVGRSAAGLDLLLAGREDLAPDLVAAHRRPTPPLEAGPAAARAGASAMLDVSDGLGQDLGRLAAASGVHVDVDDAAVRQLAADLLPAAGGLAGERGGPGLARRWVLAGGEDHALVAAFPASASPPAPFRRLGRVVPARTDRPALTVGGAADAVLGGWDHFA
ncbi:thiamine-phosphate kinase [Quadrisphaera sp. DSM 44207]|uniref:thiamine-phosphate kinase n=1 Tax=Quadrisphaera sp. DSM 44207 TaxID=1881057 RepID=UPI00088FDFCF|nr:thiamine-phosphate kinase [Quadrisphaera sp. DSM 44207]SDQ75456.1 thiamine-phosphate kinase [Quadrisphaera sp. DSM 44207]